MRIINKFMRNAAKAALLLSMAAALAATTAATSFGQAAPWKAPAEAEGYKSTKKANAASIAAGKKVYEKYCTLCHGEKGDGKGASSRTLLIEPASFTVKARMKSQSDGALAWKILYGRGPMPSWAPVLAEDDIWNVINYIRQFAK